MTNSEAIPLAVPIDWAALIDTARHLLTPIPPAAQPTPESIRRAISTTYYAMFHALLSSSADVLIGPPSDQATLSAWLFTSIATPITGLHTTP